MGHARALLSLDNEQDQLEVCEKIVKKGLSVRETERLIKRMKENVSRETLEKQKETVVDVTLNVFEEKLMQTLGTKVRIVQNKKGKGKIEIEFYSSDDLNRIIEKIG
jgi:ParB family chromosome partitioning protein